LLADEDPFTGAMKAEGVTTVTLASSKIADLTWKHFRDAVYKVPAEERKVGNCRRTPFPPITRLYNGHHHFGELLFA
jgi:hypothetical protein